MTDTICSKCFRNGCTSIRTDCPCDRCHNCNSAWGKVAMPDPRQPANGEDQPMETKNTIEQRERIQALRRIKRELEFIRGHKLQAKVAEAAGAAWEDASFLLAQEVGENG